MSNIPTQYAPIYISSDEEQNMPSTSKNKNKKQRVRLPWIEEQTFDNKKDCLNYIESLNIWSSTYFNKCGGSKKVTFRCNVGKKRFNCPKKLNYFYNEKRNLYIVNTTDNEHIHIDSEDNKTPEEFKTKVKEFFEKDWKPKKIQLELQKLKIPFKNLFTIKNYIAKLKKINPNPEIISYGELEQRCEEFSSVPTEENEAFIANYLIKYNNDDEQYLYSIEYLANHDIDFPNFRYFITSKALLLNATKNTVIHCDTTYKLNWQGFPVTVIGTSDKQKQFHVLGIMVSQFEKTNDFVFCFETLKNTLDILDIPYKFNVLVSDASNAIRNAFDNSFPNSKKLMCWFHVMYNINKKIRSFDKLVKISIQEDLRYLQEAQSEKIFKRAMNLFINKYQKDQPKFIDYMNLQWFNTHNLWYEGASKNLPSTNNCLESFNNVIKNEETLHYRAQMADFFPKIISAINNWSLNYFFKNKEFKKEPEITKKLWQQAHYMINKHKIGILNKEDRNIYTIPNNSKQLSIEFQNNYHNNNWNTFDQYKLRNFTMFLISIPLKTELWKTE